MHRFLMVVVIAVLSLSAISYAAETRGLRVVAKDPATNETGEVKLYNKTYAVIIGIDRYSDQRINPLSYAVRDAKGIQETLLQHYKFDEIIPLYNEQATKDRILEVLTEELPTRMGEDDALFLFWAGHGNQETGAGGKEIGFLIPYDGSWDKIRKNISMTDFKETISAKLPAKHVFYVMDACYSGLLTATRSINTKSRRDLKYLKEITRENVRQVLTAGSKGQQVLDSGGYKGHSVFTGRLIQVLEANNDFKTANEIQAIVTEHVFNDAKASSYTQKPDYARLSGNGDFVFIPSRDYQMQQMKAEQEERQKDIDKSIREQEKLNREMAELAELERKANAASNDRERQRVEDAKRVAEAKLAQERLHQQALEDEKQRRAKEEADLKQIDDERQRQLDEARQMEAKFRQDDERRQSELQRLDQEQLKKKQEEEQKLVEMRKQAEERRRKTLEAAAGSLSIEAAVAEIKATDARIAEIKCEFDSELAKQKAGAEARLNEKLKLLKQGYDQRMATLGQQKTTVTLPKPVIAPKDEFETDSEYKSRVRKADDDYKARLAEALSSGGKIWHAEEDAYNQSVRQAKEKYAEEVAALESRTANEQEVAVKPFQDRIAAIAAKEYPVSPQSLKLTVGTYDPEKGSFPVSISSNAPAASFAVEGTLPLSRDAAKLFKQQYQDGLVRPDIFMKTGNIQPVRVAMVNDGVKSDSDGYLLELYSGEFMVASEKTRRVAVDTERERLIFTDPITGLMWVRNGNIANKKMDWDDAMDWVENLDYGGYRDWRLPTVNEFKSFIDQGGVRPFEWFNINHLSNVQPGYYWTSTVTNRGSSFGRGAFSAYVADMENGGVKNYDFLILGLGNQYVWPVRGESTIQSNADIYKAPQKNAKKQKR